MQGLYDEDFVGYRVASPAELDAALREAVVAVDANVLLDLYRFRPQTSQDLIKTLRGLGDRLVVPHQALCEFWRRRHRSQDSPGAATKAATDALDKSGRSIRDALDRWARAVGVDDDEMSDLIARVDDCLGALKGELESVSQDASAEQGGDPILEQLEEILAGRVTSAPAPEERAECVAEANRRIEAQKPPGYMDSEKQDGELPEGGAGDYLVWYEATRYAKEQDRDLLIVTRDQKEDWWWRQNSDFIGPHPELTLEYRRLTGRRLYLMRPDALLARASVLDVKVDQASSADAGRIALIESATPGGQSSVMLAVHDTAPRISGQVCAMLAVDIAHFTRADRDDEIRRYLHSSLYEILRAALTESGLPWERCQHEDRGDGVLVIFPPDLAAQPIIDPLPERLRRLVRRHNRLVSEPAQMQLRVAANVGPVYRDNHGFIGDDVVFLFRMLDAPPLRRALSESGTEVAFVVSDYIYEKLVLRSRGLADPRSFRPVRFRVGQTPVHAWIYLLEESPP